MSDDLVPIKVLFEVVRTQTMQSNAIRVVLEASEKRTDLLQIFADAQRDGYLLETVFLPVKPEIGNLTELDDETKKGSEGKCSSMGRRRTTNRRDKR